MPPSCCCRFGEHQFELQFVTPSFPLGTAVYISCAPQQLNSLATGWHATAIGRGVSWRRRGGHGGLLRARAGSRLAFYGVPAPRDHIQTPLRRCRRSCAPPFELQKRTASSALSPPPNILFYTQQLNFRAAGRAARVLADVKLARGVECESHDQIPAADAADCSHCSPRSEAPCLLLLALGHGLPPPCPECRMLTPPPPKFRSRRCPSHRCRLRPPASPLPRARPSSPSSPAACIWLPMASWLPRSVPRQCRQQDRTIRKPEAGF